MATSLAPKPAATPFTGVILAVILGSPVGQSFVPAHIPLGSSARSSAWGAGFGWRGTAARGIRSMAMYADVGIQGGALQVGIGDEAGWCGGTSRRRRTRLYVRFLRYFSCCLLTVTDVTQPACGSPRYGSACSSCPKRLR